MVIQIAGYPKYCKNLEAIVVLCYEKLLFDSGLRSFQYNCKPKWNSFFSYGNPVTFICDGKKRQKCYLIK